MKLSLRFFCLALGLLGFTLQAAPDKPNVVLFLVDDMGWMDTSVYGSEYYETPNMERLAKQSMRFTEAYAVPLCSPTRATILTGQHSARHRVTSASGHQTPQEPGASLYPEKASPNKKYIYAQSKNYLDPSFASLAEVLKDAGYRTGHFGKWHLGLTEEYRPAHHGFETTWQCAPDPGPPSYFSPYGVVPEGRPGKVRVGNITDGPDGEYITDRLTDEALAFIEAHKEEAFFLNLWQYGVHGPWGHKEEYTREFAKKDDPRGFQKNPIMASMLKSVDESLGRVMDKLDELGLAENTLFVFFSDNGGNTHSNTPDDRKRGNLPKDHPKQEFFKDWEKWAGPEPPTNNAPLREGKGRIYEGGQRVPFMVRWPGHIQGGTVNEDAIVGAIDLYPTILDALNVSKPADHIVDGTSILSVLEGKETLERDTYFTWFPHLIPAASVRKGDWKLIQRWESHPVYPETRELYNLREDIGETKNLASAHPEKVAELEALIAKFVKDTDALVPIPNPAYNESLTTQIPEAGLVPKSSKISVQDGFLRVEADGRAPFLGTAQVKHVGPMTLNLQARSEVGGTGKVQWKTSDQEDFAATGQQVAFEIPAGEGWQDITVEVPVEGRSSTIRLYLPAAEKPVEIQSIRYVAKGSNAVVKEWDFKK